MVYRAKHTLALFTSSTATEESDKSHQETQDE